MGLANPSGHLSMTWPAHANDTVSQYNESTALYPGDNTGTHPDRFAGDSVHYSEGIYVGYRFFDRERITPQFPFGWGLSYTTFRLSHLTTNYDGNGVDVTFNVTNTGKRADGDCQGGNGNIRRIGQRPAGPHRPGRGCQFHRLTAAATCPASVAAAGRGVS